jgi:hypothetical protein
MMAWIRVVLAFACAAACNAEHVGQLESAVTTSAELPVDQPVASQEAGGQVRPQLACIGETCLAMWGEYTTSAPGMLQVARVDAITGAVIDTSPVAIASMLGNTNVPFDSLSCAGSACVAVWLDVRSGYTTPDVYAARLDATAMTVADATGIAISTSGTAAEPVVACCATECFVSWYDYGATQWLGRRISPTTGALDATAITLPDRVNAATCTGSDWLLVQEFGLGMRVASDGTLIDTTPLPLTSPAADAFDARVACNGTDCLVAFMDQRDTTTNRYSIYANRFDAAAGTVVDANDTVISTDPFVQMPSPACIAQSCVVAYESYLHWPQTQIWGARVDLATGAVGDPGGFPIFTTGHASLLTRPDQLPFAACGAGTCMVAWQDYSLSEHVFASRLDPVTAAVGDPAGIMLALGPNVETKPAVACGGGGCLAVWIDTRGPFPRGFGVRVDPTQPAVLDASASRLGSYTTRIRTGCGTADCLVAWEVPGSNGEFEADAIYAVRASRATGLAIDGAPFVIANFGYLTSPSVACEGDGCVVVWQSVGTIVGTRVDLTTGVVTDPDGVILSAQAGSAPSIACANGSCLLAWAGAYAYAARYDLATGVVADAPALQLSTGAFYTSMPAVACGATSCLASWLEHPTGSAWEIHGARVDLATGAIADADLLLATSTATGLYAPTQDVACEGDDCFVVWQDVRGGVPDLFLTRVDKHTDAVLDLQGTALTASPDLEKAPAIATDGSGNYVVAYSRPDVTASGVDRVELRVVVARQAGQPCSEDAECFDTPCIAGRCGGPRDAGVDAAVVMPDAGMPDASVRDAGVPDAGVRDAGVLDAGVFDAVVMRDAAVPDAASPPLPPNGCSCAGGTPSNGIVCVLVMLVGLRFRRRTRARRN